MSDVTAAVARALDRGLGADEHLVVLGAGSADLADDARAAGLVATHGRHRVWAAPPGTAGALCGLAVGAARAGVRPVVLLPAGEGAGAALEQLGRARAGAADDPTRPPGLVVLAPAERAGAGAAGLAATLAGVAGWSVVVPAGARDLAALLPSALRAPGPVLVLEPDSATDPDPVDGPVGDPAAELLGTARRRLAGDDVTVVALGRLVGPALAAAERLAGRGVRVEVVDVRTLAPLDLATLTASVAHTGRLVVAADTLATGAVVTARLVEAAFYDLDAAAVQVTPPSGGTGVGAVAAVVAAVERARR